ncbi:MAG: hypothetical protein A1D16_09465 [Flavihumibacter sp. CACIAM 22H1]|nr:MAG: hypothetical protein A1D16_09465 [Flavihumibacter sp. CACIAM 22H1]
MGRPATLRDIILGDSLNDFDSILELRRLDPSSPDYDLQSKAIKARLQMFSPSALLRSRKNDPSQVVHHSRILQLDFDSKDVYQYDLSELKQCIFSLPFIAYSGLSCSGRGIYALVAIAEPERQREYAEHLFQVFAEYGIKADTSKGRNVNDCRFVSWDQNYLLREDPTPLKVKRLRTERQKSTYGKFTPFQSGPYPSGGLLQTQVANVLNAQCGQRWETVQRAAYTLGGTQDQQALDGIIQAIYSNPQFQGQEAKYIKCAQDCFNAGTQKPLTR